jgi:hypothetical protein
MKESPNRSVLFAVAFRRPSWLALGLVSSW